MMWPSVTANIITFNVYGIMAHSPCTGPGMGTGPGTMGFYTMPCTVHTTLRPGTGQGMGMGTNGYHTDLPIPCHVPCPVQCEQAITVSGIRLLPFTSTGLLGHSAVHRTLREIKQL